MALGGAPISLGVALDSEFASVRKMFAVLWLRQSTPTQEKQHEGGGLVQNLGLAEVKSTTKTQRAQREEEEGFCRDQANRRRRQKEGMSGFQRAMAQGSRGASLGPRAEREEYARSGILNVCIYSKMARRIQEEVLATTTDPIAAVNLRALPLGQYEGVSGIRIQSSSRTSCQGGRDKRGLQTSKRAEMLQFGSVSHWPKTSCVPVLDSDYLAFRLA
jgi:hypothetical protein